MRKHLVVTVALAAVALASAVPAFTADSGTVTVVLTAEETAATPCLTVGPGTLDLGTAAFSTPAARSELRSRTPGVQTENCGTAPENVAVMGTDAVGPGGTWALGYWVTDSSGGNPCDAGANVYFLQTNGSTAGVSLQATAITKASRLLGTAPNDDPGVWGPGATADIALGLTMPCQGSNGAGETKSLSVTFTAVLT